MGSSPTRDTKSQMMLTLLTCKIIIEKMRIKLSDSQLNHLSHRIPFEVILDGARDVKGFLEILGHNMPWDDLGLSKFGDPLRKPNRVAFSVEAVDGGFVCDVHPAFACYLSNLLTPE